jgi:hypothetical protein
MLGFLVRGRLDGGWWAGASALAAGARRRQERRCGRSGWRLGESGGGEQAGDQGSDNFFHDEIL